MIEAFKPSNKKRNGKKILSFIITIWYLISYLNFCKTGRLENERLESGLVQPLLVNSKEKQDEDGEQDFDDSEEASEESHRPATSIASAYRLLTPSVKVWLFTLNVTK